MEREEYKMHSDSMTLSEYNDKLEEKYYPIYWKIVDDEIEITDRNNKIIPKKCAIHSMERNFIEEQIQSELKFSGEILCI